MQSLHKKEDYIYICKVNMAKKIILLALIS